jgi:ferredoxin
VVICTGLTDAAIVMLRFAVAVCAGELESATRTVNDTVPDAVGVPVIWPAAFKLNPAGNAPPDKDQL